MNNTTGGMAGTTGGSGWQCTACGAWVPYSSTHTCMPFAPMPQQQGWKCPNCHSAHAPTVLTCPNGTTPYRGAVWGAIPGAT